jgi:prepilin-type processing-associated H-X9-DG protein
LAAILFPVFAQAREKARQITCVSNMKEIGTATMMYVQDYDETFPMVYFNYGDPRWPNQNVDWSYVEQPYVKNGTVVNNPGPNNAGTQMLGGVWGCPSYPDAKQAGQFHVREDIFVPDWEFPSNWAGTPTTATLAMIDKPASKMMMFEGGLQYIPAGNGDMNGSEMFTDYWFGWASSFDTNGDSIGRQDIDGIHGDCDQTAASGPGYWDSCNYYPRYRHNNTSDFLWLDGHAKAMSKGQLSWSRDIYLGRMDEGVPAPSWYYNGPY